MKKLNIEVLNTPQTSTETDLLAKMSSNHFAMITRAHQISQQIAGINMQIYRLSLSGLREEFVDEKISEFQRSLTSLYDELEKHEAAMEKAWA